MNHGEKTNRQMTFGYFRMIFPLKFLPSVGLFRLRVVHLVSLVLIGWLPTNFSVAISIFNNDGCFKRLFEGGSIHPANHVML